MEIDILDRELLPYLIVSVYADHCGQAEGECNRGQHDSAKAATAKGLGEACLYG